VSETVAGWYLLRMRRMSVTEVVHRLLDEGRRRAWARRQVRPGDVPPLPAKVATERAFGSPLPADARCQVPADAVAAVVSAADRVFRGTWTVFGARRADSAAPDWFLDPLSGRRAPDDKLAFRIRHRDESVTGNVKQVWELSRHHHLTVLAAAWWLTGHERYAQLVADQLRSWWSANPFLCGVHWTSGIEIGVRLMSWVWIRRLLDDWPKVGDLFENDDDAVRQIGWHQEYLARLRSHGSSANNHVLAEAAGQLAASCAFPWYHFTSTWRQGAADLLERELLRNTFPSGLNRELATDYHRFVLELALVAAVEAQVAGHDLSSDTWQRLTRMLDAGAALLDTAGRPPRQGDGDEGRGLVVDDPQRDPWSVALGTAAAVLGLPSWCPAPRGSVQAALLGALARPHDPGRYLDRPTCRPHRFADAGLAILRSRPQDGPEIWCRCDGGPHGYLSIAAHAHADALSVEVRHEGVEILVDPGTYCYHGEPAWRRYFRSTLAHNTLEVAQQDQAASGGPFLWTTHPRTEQITCDVGERAVQLWIAQHDGYRRLDSSVMHRRGVTLDSPGRLLTVVDTLDTNELVAFRLAWHLGPDISVELDGGHALLSWRANGSRQLGRLTLPQSLTWTAHRGEKDPVLGWYSPAFGQRLPSTSLVGVGAGRSWTHLVTTLCLS
jgi:hypothetical protein